MSAECRLTNYLREEGALRPALAAAREKLVAEVEKASSAQTRAPWKKVVDYCNWHLGLQHYIRSGSEGAISAGGGQSNWRREFFEGVPERQDAKAVLERRGSVGLSVPFNSMRCPVREGNMRYGQGCASGGGGRRSQNENENVVDTVRLGPSGHSDPTLRTKCPPFLEPSQPACYSRTPDGNVHLDDKCLVSSTLPGDSDTEPRLSSESSISDRDITAPNQNKAEPPALVNTRITTSCRVIGKPIAKEEARRRWPHRYKFESAEGSRRKLNSSSKENILAHYSKAEVDHHVYELGDYVFVNAISTSDFLGKVLELFKKADGSLWFRVQWFYRIGDTSIGKDAFEGHDPKRVFFSEAVDDNLLECLVEKKQVLRLKLPPRFKFPICERVLPPCDFYYDMGYDAEYSRFYELPEDLTPNGGGDLSTLESSEELTSAVAESNLTMTKPKETLVEEDISEQDPEREAPENGNEISLLDLYSGCGAMSTGLCMGAQLSDANLKTLAELMEILSLKSSGQSHYQNSLPPAEQKWAVDLSSPACMSLKHNHPDTEVRCESADSFYSLIVEWDNLCREYEDSKEEAQTSSDEKSDDDDSDDDQETGEDVYEVEKIIGIRWSESCEATLSGKKRKSPLDANEGNDYCGLRYKVRWKGYSEEDDTWEPIENVAASQRLIRNFVLDGKAKRILPLPGECDVICGGPPCQGISGFNRFRNILEPLKCERNRQVITYMNIVEFLKPRFILMENVVDILKFVDGYLGRYALSRLVQMHYQAKLGLMVAGCYGLPQFRMRVFLWGAAPGETLPLYPLPTHFVVTRGFAPQNFERNVVAYDESEEQTLRHALVLEDAISDLPKIGNNDKHDEMSYDKEPETDFQKVIRLPPEAYKLRATACTTLDEKAEPILYDHRSLELNEDDLQRTERVPKRKGANFRDLEKRGSPKQYLPSGKPLIPAYALSFVQGKSNKPFGRLWWDETVSTVVTRAEPHNQCVLHPVQDRVMSVRENARLQGFPDWYKLFGTVKERYIQVGNAVAVPVARALGYALAQSLKSELQDSDEADDPRAAEHKRKGVMELPADFPQSLM